MKLILAKRVELNWNLVESGSNNNNDDNNDNIIQTSGSK